MRISDWSSDGCSSDLEIGEHLSDFGMAVKQLDRFDEGLDGIVVARVLSTRPHPNADKIQLVDVDRGDGEALQIACGAFNMAAGDLVPLATVGTTMPGGMEIGRRKMRGEWRSEEHTSELQSLMRISYAVFCLKNKKKRQQRAK